MLALMPVPSLFETSARFRRELLLFGRAGEGGRRGVTLGEHLRDVVEIAGADEFLVLDGPITRLALVLELALLKVRIGGHAALAISPGELEHGEVQGMEAG